MGLTLEEIQIILEALEAKYGPGYWRKPGVGRLQAKLSIMLEVKTNSAREKK